MQLDFWERGEKSEGCWEWTANRKIVVRSKYKCTDGMNYILTPKIVRKYISLGNSSYNL